MVLSVATLILSGWAMLRGLNKETVSYAAVAVPWAILSLTYFGMAVRGRP